MTHTDDVMKELWLAKQTIVKRHKNVAAYVAFLRKQGKRNHPGGRVAAPPSGKGADAQVKSR